MTKGPSLLSSAVLSAQVREALRNSAAEIATAPAAAPETPTPVAFAAQPTRKSFRARAWQTIRPLARLVAGPFVRRAESRMRHAVLSTGVLDRVEQAMGKLDGIAGQVSSLGTQVEALGTATKHISLQGKFYHDVLFNHIAVVEQRLARVSDAVYTEAATLSGHLNNIDALLANGLQQISSDAALGHASIERSLADITTLSFAHLIPMPNGIVLSRSPIGYLALDQGDPATLGYLANGQTPEAGTVSLTQALLRRGGGFIDVGANVGVFSLVAARCVGLEGKVLACEPTPRTVEVLRTTLATNGMLDRVHIEQVAVGRETSTLNLHITPISGHNSLYPLDEATTSIEVSVRSLDDLTEPGSSWNIVKIDVEGAELDVLAGMTRLMADNPSVLAIAEFGPTHLGRVGTSIEQWFGAWTDRGFVAFEIDDLRPVIRPLRTTGLDDIESLNILFAAHGDPRTSQLLAAD